MLRVVIDPNVLLSALIAPGGTSDQALRAAVMRTVVVVSPHLLERFVRRATEDKFRRWSAVADAQELTERLADLADVVDDPPAVPRVVEQDPSDDYLVAVARRSQAHRLLTGDQGIRRALWDATDVKVASPAELLRELTG